MTPAPGSDAAVAAGCTCPLLDNAHGAGCGSGEDGTTLYWRTAGCPLHDAGGAVV